MCNGPSPGLWTPDLPAGEKKELGIAPDGFALRVRGIFKPAARRAGLRVGDIIVGYDGKKPAAMSNGQFGAYLRLNHWRPGSVLRLEVLRDGKKRDIAVKF